MKDTWNNVNGVCCKPWLVLPTVYNDALSYGEQLDKFCYSLNKVIENNNILPSFISDLIKEYVSNGAIGEVIRDALSNYILNVKYPPKGLKPAVGDGSADDTEAIQGCIDYALTTGYGAVYFPNGKYLTAPLIMKNNVSLFAFDRYSTELVLKGGATAPLLSGNVTNTSISNFTINGNAGIQVNNITLIQMTGNNIMLNNLILTDGYKLLDYTGNGGHLQMNDIVFGSCVTNAATLSGNCTAQVEDLIFNKLSEVGGVDVFNISLNGGYFKFTSNAICPTCLTLTGNDNVIECMITNAQKNVSDSGQRNNIKVRGVSAIEAMTGDKTVSVGGNLVEKIGGTLTETITGNKNIGVSNITENVTEVKTTIADKISETSNNKTVDVMADFVEDVSGNKTQRVNGNHEVTIEGNSSETVTQSKNISAEDIVLNPTNPLTYKTPEKLNSFFDYVPMKDKTGKVYNVLVYNGKPFNGGNNTMSLGYCILEKSTTLDTEGSCCYLKTSNNDFYLFDLGRVTSFNTIKEQLIKAGCSKIKGVIISHYHGDHISNIDLWKSNFDMSETVFYLPLATTKFPESENAIDQFKRTFPNNTIIFPENNSSYELMNSNNDTFSLEFNNCGVAVRNYYDLNTDDYNDYSMCAYVVHGDDVLAFVGDISTNAQKYMYDSGMGRKVTTITAPHHGVITAEGYQPLWRIWTPQFVFIPNNYYQQNLTGLRSPFISICRLYGAKITASVENSDTVIVTSTGTGVIFGNYYPSLTSWYSNEGIANLYVDEEYKGDVQNGNEETPFADLQRACNATAGYPTKITIIKCSKNLTLINQKNITIDLGDNTLNYLTMHKCSNIIIQNGTINGSGLDDNTNCKLSNISSPVGLIQNRGFMYFENCKITNPVDKAFTFNSCYGVIMNGTVTVNKSAIYCNASVVTGFFALGGFHANTSNARLIWVESGECFIGRHNDNTAVLKNNLWYFSTTEHYKKELLFDTTENRYCYLAPTGDLVYLAYKNDIPVTA